MIDWLRSWQQRENTSENKAKRAAHLQRIRDGMARIHRYQEVRAIRAFLEEVEQRLNVPGDRLAETDSTFEPPPQVPGGDRYRQMCATVLAEKEREMKGCG